jgi:hypothetical protein
MIDVNNTDPATIAAQLRMKRGMGYEYKAPQGQMIGRVYVGSNPLQHVAEALRGYQASQDQTQGLQELKDIKNQRQEALVSGLRTFNEQYQGTPEKRTEVPQQVMVAGDGANDGEMTQGSVTNVTPAVKGNPLAAISGLAGSQNPMLAQAGVGMLAQYPQQREAALQRAADKQEERTWRSQEKELDRKSREDNLRLTAQLTASNRPERQAQIIDTDQGKMRVMPNGQLAPLMDVSGNAISGPKGPTGTLARQNEAQQALNAIKQAEEILPNATSSGLGSLVDSAAGFVGYSTPGAQAASKLKAVEGELVSKMPKMSGPQSDKDVALYKQMAGVVGDETKPIATRQAALQAVKEIQNRYAGPQVNLGATGNPNSVMSNSGGRGGVVDFGSLK